MPEEQPHRGPDDAEKVEAAIDQLLAYYRMGQKSLKSHPDRVKYGESSELLRKARVFAGRYTTADLNRVIKLCRRNKTELGRSFMDRLATIPDKPTRKAIENQAIELRWSRIVLDRELRRRFGSRRRSGRAPHRPKDVDEALSELIRLSMKLTRWGEAMGWDPNTGRIADREGFKLDNLPAETLKHVKAGLRATHKAKEAADASLRQRR